MGTHWRGGDYRSPEEDPAGIHVEEGHCTVEGIGWRVATVGEEVDRNKKGGHSEIASLVGIAGHRIVDPGMGAVALEAGNIRRCMGERESCCWSARMRGLKGTP